MSSSSQNRCIYCAEQDTIASRLGVCNGNKNNSYKKKTHIREAFKNTMSFYNILLEIKMLIRNNIYKKKTDLRNFFSNTEMTGAIGKHFI